MSNVEQDDNKKDLALIMARLSQLIEANTLENIAPENHDFAEAHQHYSEDADQVELVDDVDENYPELTDVAELGDLELIDDTLIDDTVVELENFDTETPTNAHHIQFGSAQDTQIFNTQMLDTLMVKLTPAIGAAVNSAIERVLTEAKEPLKQQLDSEIRAQILKLLEH